MPNWGCDLLWIEYIDISKSKLDQGANKKNSSLRLYLSPWLLSFHIEPDEPKSKAKEQEDTLLLQFTCSFEMISSIVML